MSEAFFAEEWWNAPYKKSEDDIQKLPSANPQPKTGYWIKTSNGFKCSKCLIVHKHHSIYCPSCGAKMIESPESEENGWMNGYLKRRNK